MISFTWSGIHCRITAWNQQVPLPQDFTGDNAWRITLKPEPADEPVYGTESLFKGAIAVAANGVPIFNPIKQDGRTDTNLAGELDEFGAPTTTSASHSFRGSGMPQSGWPGSQLVTLRFRI